MKILAKEGFFPISESVIGIGFIFFSFILTIVNSVFFFFNSRKIFRSSKPKKEHLQPSYMPITECSDFLSIYQPMYRRPLPSIPSCSFSQFVKEEEGDYRFLNSPFGHEAEGPLDEPKCKEA